MKIETLEKYGIPKEVTKFWLRDGVRQLLPIQIQSVSRFGLLDGQSLIISGPGTSGKTFCGEMAALRQASQRRKAVFIVPLKAIAEEKYRLFKKRYSPLGLDIAISTRDHSNHDREISKSRFDILISIYEKINSLSSADVSLIANCGCFILDEFQLISDPRRGAELELLMAKIRKFNPRAQAVILLGGGSSPGRISRWLNLPVLEETRRPVDLRIGVLFKGTFHFRGFNDHREGDEQWLEKRDPEDMATLDPQTLSAIKLLSEKGEQTIIFTASKRKAIGLAEYLAGHLDLRPAKDAINRLNDLPQSLQSESLGRCFYGGTGFHHADLDHKQRALVEENFRNGALRVLVSTSTLAWGVNLPAKNVFIESMKYTSSTEANCRNSLTPLSMVDFYQAAGRAGRVGYKKDYGRAILTASSPFEHEVLWENYVYGNMEELDPGTSESDLSKLILRLVVCGAGGSISEISECMNRMFWITENTRISGIDDRIEQRIGLLVKSGFIANDYDGRFYATELGRLTAGSGFSIKSIMGIKERIEKGETANRDEWIYFSLGLKEWTDNCGLFVLRGVRKSSLVRRINELSNGSVEDSDYLQKMILNPAREYSDYRAAAFLFVLEWISGRPTRVLESVFDRGSGGFRQDAILLQWIITTVARTIKAVLPDSNENLAAELDRIAIRLKFGLPDEKIPLALCLNIDREYIDRLYELGIVSPDDLRTADLSFLGEFLPREELGRIKRYLARDISTGDETRIEFENNSACPILFTGNTRGTQKEIIFGGVSFFLQPKLYNYFQKLWLAADTDTPWIYKESLEPGINQAKYISKLRKILRSNEIDIKIVTNGNGYYRLLLPEGIDRPAVIGDK